MTKYVKVLLAILVSVTAASAQLSSNVQIFATSLDNPRGLKFGPDGDLYVAEGGRGGFNSTVGACPQVVAPVGPYTGDHTARISKINSGGVRTTVVDNLPSSQTAPSLGSFVSGVADIAFVDDTLYALLSGAGCSHGIPDVPNGIIRVNTTNATWTLVANLSAFQMANPVKNPEPNDFEPDGTWYSMIEVRGNLYAVEPNHGELDVITPSGGIQRLIDVSASQGHIVPTALAYRGNFYVGNLRTFPIEVGSSNVFRITPSGNIRVDTGALTTVLGLVFDQRNRMYALEMSPAPGLPTPFIGRVVRVSPSGSKEVIASGLTFPTGMTLGPDGKLYVSNFGFGFPPGAGQVVRITVPE